MCERTKNSCLGSSLNETYSDFLTSRGLRLIELYCVKLKLIRESSLSHTMISCENGFRLGVETLNTEYMICAIYNTIVKMTKCSQQQIYGITILILQ